MINPYTGEIINGRKLIPYVQLRLKHEAFDEISRYPKSTLNNCGKEYIPWLLGYEDEAQEELQRVHNLWKEVREHLTENGTYCKLAEFEPWVPLNKL